MDPHEIDEKSMRFLEEQIPAIAELAGRKAYLDTLVSGDSVLICEKGTLLEIHPDGSRSVIKQLPPPIPVPQWGRRMEI